MANALLDADQCPQEGIFAQIHSRKLTSQRMPIWDSQSLEAGLVVQRIQFQSVTPIDRSGREGTAIDAHFSDGRRALVELKRFGLRAREIRRFQDATHWLSQNRLNYRGLWVALDGANLLFAAASAKEVFSSIGGVLPPPLVIRVEEDETPFAGW